jgi:transposase-like protein
VIASGLAAVVAGVTHWQSSGLGLFASILLLGAIASILKVTIAGNEGSMSMNFIFIMLAVARLGLGESLCVGVCSSLLQTFWRPKNHANPIQAVFNVSLIAALIGVSHTMFPSKTLRSKLLIMLGSGVKWFRNLIPRVNTGNAPVGALGASLGIGWWRLSAPAAARLPRLGPQGPASWIQFASCSVGVRGTHIDGGDFALLRWRHESTPPTRQSWITALLKKYEQSGLTRAEFSRREGISVSTLDYYRRQQARRGKEQQPEHAQRLVRVRVTRAGAAPHEDRQIQDRPLVDPRFRNRAHLGNAAQTAAAAAE